MPPKARTAADKVWKDTTEFSLIVSLKSRTGRSFTDKGLRVTRQNLEYFIPDAKTHAEARRELEREGFKLLAQSRLGLSIRGPKKLIQEFFQAEIDVHRMAARRHGKLLKTRVPQGRLTVPPKLSPLIDSVIFDLYPTPLESATPPAAGYYHLGVPGDVAEILGASQLHPCGFDGSGIKLCMVDDGFFSHAYYATRGYDITLVPVVEEVMPPSTGHGTAIASNALAVAPGVEFLFANMYDADENSVLLAALRRAKDQNPDIITCSWGIKCPLMYPDLGPLTWEIADAVNNGVVVVFACGNDGPVHFPGCMDEVISVGGVFPEEGGGFHAATYASSGECSVNSGRQCPDVCGLVGDRPAGVLIMMPTVPGGYYDDLFASEDATTVDDGWLCASGTSSAAPQVAGLAALLLQCDPTLAPDEVKAILQNTAKDITAGSSASGQAAGPGVDLATGYGLVDAVAAMEAAGCTCVPCEDYCETSCTTFCRANCMTTCETGEIADCKAQCQPFSEPCVPKCDSSCVTFCQGGCITIREGQCSKCEPACMIKCEGACLAGCEPGCMTMCEGRCMTGCVVGGCQVGCMGIC